MTMIELLGRYKRAVASNQRVISMHLERGASSAELFEMLHWQGCLKHHQQVLLRFIVYPFIAPDPDCNRLQEQNYVNALCHDLTVSNANTLSHILIFLNNAYTAYLRWDAETVPTETC